MLTVCVCVVQFQFSFTKFIAYAVEFMSARWTSRRRRRRRPAREQEISKKNIHWKFIISFHLIGWTQRNWTGCCSMDCLQAAFGNYYIAQKQQTNNLICLYFRCADIDTGCAFKHSIFTLMRSHERVCCACWCVLFLVVLSFFVCVDVVVDFGWKKIIKGKLCGANLILIVCVLRTPHIVLFVSNTNATSANTHLQMNMHVLKSLHFQIVYIKAL